MGFNHFLQDFGVSVIFCMVFWVIKCFLQDFWASTLFCQIFGFQIFFAGFLCCKSSLQDFLFQIFLAGFLGSKHFLQDFCVSIVLCRMVGFEIFSAGFLCFKSFLQDFWGYQICFAGSLCFNDVLQDVAVSRTFCRIFWVSMIFYSFCGFHNFFGRIFLVSMISCRIFRFPIFFLQDFREFGAGAILGIVSELWHAILKSCRWSVRFLTRTCVTRRNVRMPLIVVVFLSADI